MKASIVNLKNVFVSLAFVWFVGVAVNHLTLKYFRDYDHWVLYTAIDAEKQDNLITDQLWILSYLNVYRAVSVSWEDILRCRPWGSDGLFGRVSRFSSDASNLRVGDQRITRWAYGNKLPQVDSECFIQTTIFVHANEYITHKQEMDSSTFRVRPPS